MSKSLNRVFLMGNLGSDPEIRTIPSGSRVAQFSVATSKRWTDRKTNVQHEKTEWHRIVAWDSPINLVDVIERYLRKGDQVHIEGEIEYRQYQDRDGNTRYVTEIKARDVILCGGKRDGVSLREEAEAGGGTRSGARQPAAVGAAGSGGGEYDDFQAPPLEDDDDLPF